MRLDGWLTGHVILTCIMFYYGLHNSASIYVVFFLLKLNVWCSFYLALVNANVNCPMVFTLTMVIYGCHAYGCPEDHRNGCLLKIRHLANRVVWNLISLFSRLHL